MHANGTGGTRFHRLGYLVNRTVTQLGADSLHSGNLGIQWRVSGSRLQVRYTASGVGNVNISINGIGDMTRLN